MHHIIALLFAFILLLPTAHAGLIDLGNSTLDDSTNLEWLDLTITAASSTPFDAPGDGGVSVDDLINGFGGLFIDGYRHATEEELLALWGSVGLTGDGNFDPSYISGVTTLIGLFGEPDPDDPRGIYQYNSSYKLGDLQLARSSENIPVTARSTIQTGNSDLGIYWQQSHAGHYLVRTAASVPATPTFWLLLSSVMLCSILSRKTG